MNYDCEPQYVEKKTNLGLLQDQQVLVITAASVKFLCYVSLLNSD